MLVVAATLSIAPGHTPGVIAAALEQLQGSAAHRRCQCVLSAEICEVNTLLCLFAGDTLQTMLADVQDWLAALSGIPTGHLLRHMGCDVHDTSASEAQLRQLAGPEAAAVLLQVFRGKAPEANGSLRLSHVTGILQRTTVLTAVRHHDEAVALARDTVEGGADIADSGLWLPVTFPIFESNP